MNLVLSFPFSVHFLFMRSIAGAVSPPKILSESCEMSRTPKAAAFFCQGVFWGHFCLLCLSGYLSILSQGYIISPLIVDWGCQIELLVFKLYLRGSPTVVGMYEPRVPSEVTGQNGKLYVLWRPSRVGSDWERPPNPWGLTVRAQHSSVGPWCVRQAGNANYATESSRPQDGLFALIAAKTDSGWQEKEELSDENQGWWNRAWPQGALVGFDSPVVAKRIDIWSWNCYGLSSAGGLNEQSYGSQIVTPKQEGACSGTDAVLSQSGSMFDSVE